MTAFQKEFLEEAISQARLSVQQGGFPAGAVIIKNNAVIGRGISIGNLLNDPTSHGEMAAIRNACASVKTSGLSGAALYASMQPCLMCFGASMWSGISRIFYACSQKQVSAEYYGGTYDTHKTNDRLLQPIDLIHCAEYEAESLAIVREWEKQFQL